MTERIVHFEFYTKKYVKVHLCLTGSHWERGEGFKGPRSVGNYDGMPWGGVGFHATHHLYQGFSKF